MFLPLNTWRELNNLVSIIDTAKLICERLLGCCCLFPSESTANGCSKDETETATLKRLMH